MRPFRAHLRWPLLLGACCLSTALHATPPAQQPDRPEPAASDYRQLNLELVDQHVIPRYRQLSDATRQLEQHARQFCAAGPDTVQAEREALEQGWHQATDAWQAVQHIRFGPVELFMRSMRFSFWPDPRNTVGRQLDALLATADPAALDPQAFARGTIAVQGFPALERLLTADEPLGAEAGARASKDTTDAARYRCAVLVAITHNLSSMASDTLAGWLDGEGTAASGGSAASAAHSLPAYRQVIADAAAEGGHYHLDREATQDFFKSLNTALELIADHKLARPLGPSLQAARPQLAEAWRSQRSLEYVRSNLAAAEALYLGAPVTADGTDSGTAGDGGFSAFVRTVAGDGELDALLRRALAQTRATAHGLSLPLEAAVQDPQARKQVEKLVREASALKALVTQRLAPALSIPVGFNALDGD